jgi:hydrogen peroxide-dependent heme synthase
MLEAGWRVNGGPYTYYSAFKRHVHDGVDCGSLSDELNDLADRHRVSIRGVYATLGFRTDSDLAMWWIAESADDIQSMLADLHRSTLGVLLTQSWAFLGLHRPPEVAKDHMPAFMQDEPPRKHVVIYPFIRTAEWYLMPRDERALLLREHGEMGCEFPSILANTTSGFGLGDWEWILAFEADELSDLVDCMRRLRDAEVRRYTKDDTPFITGIRGEAKDVFSLLW